MKPNRPLLIVTSCTRNYGWVTRAFLEGNTRWADYIVIVDQMSTDATRPLIEEYNALHYQEEKAESQECIHRAEIVIVDDPDMTYKESTRAKMGFMKGRELAAGRDAIYFALDIDEVMPANWMQTEDGKKILNSKPGDMFQIEWANILPGMKEQRRYGWQYKVFHDNGMDWQESDRQMHTPLLPYSSWDEEDMHSVHDFPLLHFGICNPKWSKYKSVYYKFLDVRQHRSSNVISLHRGTILPKEVVIVPQSINNEWLYEDVDMLGQVDAISTPIFVQYIKEIIKEEGIEKFKSIDVWSEELCRELEVKDPRTAGWKMLHRYLRCTQKHKRTKVIRGMDKILKVFV